MRLALVGATGLVGRTMMDVLAERKLQITEFIPVASEKSVGKSLTFLDRDYRIVSMEDAVAARPDVAIFSAGGTTSKQWAPAFAEAGTYVVDNSSAWRMEEGIHLVVPEINGNNLRKNDFIIANPNCSTIQMVMALHPLDQAFGIRRLVISTYQSFTGTGAKAVNQYAAEKEGRSLNREDMAYHYPIFENAIPQCDVFLDNRYTREEMKLVDETRKILGKPDIRITATAVRIPVDGGHSESVNVEFEKDFEMDNVQDLLKNTPGVQLLDDPANHAYPMPRFAKGKDDVFVGRVRRDYSNPNSLNLWIVSDNLRKGAATNAVQIVQYLKEQSFFSK